MAVPLPSSLPPVELHDKVLSILLSRLRSISIGDTTELMISTLQSVLQILAYQSLHSNQRNTVPTYPLQLLINISESNPISLQLNTLIDAVIAYPLHHQAINELLSRCFESNPAFVEQVEQSILPNLLRRIRQYIDNPEHSFPAVRTLITLARAHEEMLGLILGEADVFLSALSNLYASLTINTLVPEVSDEMIRIKQDILLIVYELVSAMQGEESKGMIKRLLGDADGFTTLVDAGLRDDYLNIIERHSKPREDIVESLKRLKRREESEDPRLNTLVSLFPHIPTTLLNKALSHPFFAAGTSSASAEEGAAPLVEAILGGGSNLPDDLNDLRNAIESTSQVEIDHNGVGSSSALDMVKPKAKIERRNIWDDELDISRLRIKDSDEASLPQVAAIPDHLRASILRLVESQVVEEDERERAVAEAHSGFMLPGNNIEDGFGDDDNDDDVSRVKMSTKGDDSEDDEGENSTNLVDKTRRPPQIKTYDPDLQSKLELAYLSNPGVFDRDGQTRRSEGRRKLKDATGMDDSQLEGWRIMLERNPHKDAILARHQCIPPNNKDYLTPPRSENGSSSSKNSRGGGRGGRGGGGSKRGGGSNQGGEGSSRGGSEGGSNRDSGGGNRGRGQNKGNRGHQNAARTRGHDKKMSRMGAGL